MLHKLVVRRFQKKLLGTRTTGRLDIQIVWALSGRLKDDPHSVRRPHRAVIDRRIKREANHTVSDEIREPDIYVPLHGAKKRTPPTPSSSRVWCAPSRQLGRGR